MRFRTRNWILIVAFLLIGGLTACQNNSDGPTQNQVVVVRGQKTPVTVAVTPTVDEGILAQTPVTNTPWPTPTDAPPLPTATPTPYVGVYVGTQTDGTPDPVGLPPLVVGPNTATSSAIIIPGSGTPVPASNQNCTVAVDSTFSTAYANNAQAAQNLGCPRQEANTFSFAQQSFERGQMFWRSTNEIYVLQQGGTARYFVDSWREGQPVQDDNLSVPAGRYQPIRGFGLVWRNNNLLDAIGWATQLETGYSAKWQDFDNGAMFANGSGQVYILLLNGATGTYLGPL